MTEYQTHAALVQSLEAEVSRLQAVNAELKGIIEAGIKPNNSLAKAARQALEALEYHVEQTRPIQRTAEAITALREALVAAAEREACANVWHDEDLLEHLYWAFDNQRLTAGEERLAFKGKMRFYASEVFKKAHEIGGEA